MCCLPVLRRPLTCCLLVIGSILPTGAGPFANAQQTAGTSAPPKVWSAQWITTPDGPTRDYSVAYFRKFLSLSQTPSRFLVDVSADTRFELHVNGKRVTAGPALADVQHWRYESIDLAPYLKTGNNEIAAMVWNLGSAAPVSQMGLETAFLLSAEDAGNAAVNTGVTRHRPAPGETATTDFSNGWQTLKEPGRTAGHEQMLDYYAAEPQEVMDGRKMQWDWDSAAGLKAQWLPALVLGGAGPRGAQDSPTPWILQKDELPQMQYRAISPGHVVRSSSETSNTRTLDRPVTIPAHADVTFLLDREELTTAFPSLSLRGGVDATVDMTYAEALYDAKGEKGNRNQIEGRHIQGISDHVVSDGGSRTYRTLWWRTWRYLQVEVKTETQPLTIEKLEAFYTAYPFKAEAHFESNDPVLSKIWDTGWRTAQLCSHETYMDTPYWEQLQYVGDTRIQALLSYAVTGDDRLGRQAILAYRNSLLTDGLTQSRYPSALTQVIPPFSLLWVGMLHDFWMYRSDAAFVTSVLPATRGVIDWFAARQRTDGLMGRVEWWPFVDWSPPTYAGGAPPQEVDGGSSAITLQYIAALQDGADLEDKMGEPERAARYRGLAKRAGEGLMKQNWDVNAGLLADTPAKKTYSQQANSLAVLLDVIPGDQQKTVMTKVLQSSDGKGLSAGVPMSQASYYFFFYVARAMVHTGLGDEYIAQLEPWRKMLSMGLSTWAETPEPTRSDSHAWSAHPTLDLLTIVAGIAPGSNGFESVRITPHLGPLEQASAAMPSPKGMVTVRYTKKQSGWTAHVSLPEGLPGQVEWRGQTIPLHAGEQEIELP